MRFETLLVIGSATAADTALNWSAVLTGARWNREIRSFRPDLGNPGNPAGLDAHASGIRADGWLAYDLDVANADNLVKRVQKEIVAARSGLRDALWSLRRAFSDARADLHRGSRFCLDGTARRRAGRLAGGFGRGDPPAYGRQPASQGAALRAALAGFRP